ncbi:matrixin family metalloprotease [Candidatus Pacearchaeota archaeon]|nr:matrixin family metalloprotease [Candidatus Pacearchaeota archaeon]
MAKEEYIGKRKQKKSKKSVKEILEEAEQINLNKYKSGIKEEKTAGIKEEKPWQRRKELYAILGILISLLLFFSYLLFLSFSDIQYEPFSFLSFGKTQINNITSYTKNIQFYQNMRFSGSNISYHIDSSCSEDKIANINLAIATIENETKIIKFYPSEKNPKLSITCDSTKKQLSKEYYIAGEGGPTSVINTSLFYIIEKGEVLLFYKENNCENANIEIHEILHVFGFAHSENKNSIMYNTTSCSQILTKDIINELARLYSIKELPDLYFSKASGLKHGIYLDFFVEMSNQGIKNSGDILLKIYTENGKFGEYSFSGIKYGEGRSLEVTNMELPSRDAEKITFVIEDGEEITLKNNHVTLATMENSVD